MNKIYKKVWNRLRGCFVAVSEALGSRQARGKASLVIASSFVANTSGAVEINGDFEAYSVRWMVTPYEVTEYTGNFNWYGHKGGNGWYLVAGARSTGLPTATLIIDGDFNMFPNGSWDLDRGDFLIAMGNRYSNTNGTLHVKGNANIGDGSIFKASTAVMGYQISTVNSTFIVDGTLTVSDRATVWGGYTSGAGNGRYTSTWTINNLVLENTGTWDSPGINDSTNTFTFNATLNNATIKNGAIFRHRYNFNNLESTISFNNSLTLEAGSRFENNGGLIVGARTTNRVNIGNTLNLNGGTVTDRSSLTQNLGTINVNGAYDFANYVKTAGVLNNNSTLTLYSANISGGTFNNAGTLNLNGNASISDTINGGTVNINAGTLTAAGLSNVAINVRGGNFSYNDLGSTNSLAVYSGSATLNSLNTAKSVALTGGTLTTGYYQVFTDSSRENVGLNYINLEVQTPQEIRTSLSEWFQKYVPGEISDKLTNISFTGGTLRLTGKDLTQTECVDLAQAFKEKLSLPGFITDSNAFPVAFI